MPSTRRATAITLLLSLSVLAACSSGGKPTPQPVEPVAASPPASPPASPSLAAAVTLDDAARQGCRLLTHTKADIGEAVPGDPVLQQAADTLAGSRHYALRFDGQRLVEQLRAYRKVKGTAGEGTESAIVAQMARQLDSACAANGAYSAQG